MLKMTLKIDPLPSRHLWLIVLLHCLFSFEPIMAQDSAVIRYQGSSTIAHFIEAAEQAYTRSTFLINSYTESAGGEHVDISRRKKEEFMKLISKI